MPEDAILLGDFNLDPTNPEYDLLAGPSDGKGGRFVYREGLVDAWVAAGHEEGDGVTFPANPGFGPKLDHRFDYAFVTESLASRVRSAEVDMEAQGSDHQPFWIDIDW
jgi:endonuclease/exonuclease/phosphatase family metal-dependent hydrolase